MTTVISTEFNNIARAISAYADAARADNALILSTAIVGSDSRITDAGENYTGTVRWLNYTDGAEETKPLSTDINGSANALAAGTLMGIGNIAATYIKNVDVTAARENSVQSLISKVDGLSYLGARFGAVRARKEDTQLRQILRGVGLNVLNYAVNSTTEAAYAAPTADAAAHVQHTNGYVTAFTANTGLNTWAPLFSNLNGVAQVRSTFFDVLLDAMTAVSGEFEEPFYYLVISPETFNVLRKENVLDGQLVQDGNLNINTLLGGKIRLVVSGSTVGGIALAATTGADGHAALNMSLLIKAGAVHYSNVTVNNPTAIDANPSYNRGFGETTILSRWGNIIHPMGVSYAGTATVFPTNGTLATAGTWTNVAANVNQNGIFPIFHG